MPSHGLYISAEGAKAQSRRMEVIANNLANVDTVGFKPTETAFQARFAEAIQLGLAPAGSRDRPDLGGGVKAIETLTNFSAGRLERTGSDQDLAIIGEGFFLAQGPDDAEPLLTRAGGLEQDSIGQLTLAGSNRVLLSSDGIPIQVDPTLPWSVTKDGFVEQAGEVVPIALVAPSTLDDLQHVGGNLFQATAPVRPLTAAEREVRAGYLEMSGANATDQMMQLIETNRAFEANTQMIRHQDQATGQLIGRVLSG